MLFDLQPMKDKYMDEILSWKSQSNYSCYDTDKNETSLESLISEGETDFFVALIDDVELAGFIECTFDEEEILEVGCALMPEFVGKGLGFDFVSNCIEYLMEYYDYSQERIITVLKTKDKHARKVFERVGFLVTDESEEWIELSVNV